jgi:hypothetical protein
MKSEEEIRAELEKAQTDLKKAKKKYHKALATVAVASLLWVLEEPPLS